MRREQPDVASCLEAINDKLDVVMKILAAGEADLPDQPTHDVNLSASGLCFDSKEPIEPETVLELKLLIF